MSFLTPLYILGALAIVGPIIFHLIRRRPRGEVRFSSLMFLSPTPPTLTRRSRLDNLLLLILRGAVLALLALAFARPFLREAAQLDSTEAEPRRIAILIDTSASMRRADVWARARKVAEQAIEELRPSDEFAVYTFDVFTNPVFSFAESAALDPARRKTIATARLADLKPGWGATDLGQALVDVAGALHDLADTTGSSSRISRRIVLVSDLQRGGRTNALNTFEWPTDVEIDPRVVPLDSANAGLQLLREANVSTARDDASTLRVRISNTADADHEEYRLIWRDDEKQAVGSPINVYVPAGEGRVVRTKRPVGSATSHSLELSGDEHPFDNTLYFAETRPESAEILYVGTDTAEDPQGLLYYLSRAFDAGTDGEFSVVANSPTEELKLDAKQAVPLIVLSSETSSANVSALKRYLESGGTILAVLASADQGTALASLAGVPSLEIDEGDIDSDLMLQEIAFEHPLFAPFAAAQYNDFTKIRFWAYRTLDADQLANAQVVARFEGGDPALLETRVGDGRLLILTSGWNPEDSQLARSSKFVPLLIGLARGMKSGADSANVTVFDAVSLAGNQSEVRTVEKPDRTRLSIPADAAAFSGTDQPGVYRLESKEGDRFFAVNLDPAESRTEPLELEALEQLGCRLVGNADAAVSSEQLRQMRSAELESRQKLWRWLIVVAIMVLIVETWLAGRRVHHRPAEVATP